MLNLQHEFRVHVIYTQTRDVSPDVQCYRINETNTVNILYHSVK